MHVAVPMTFYSTRQDLLDVCVRTCCVYEMEECMQVVIFSGQRMRLSWLGSSSCQGQHDEIVQQSSVACSAVSSPDHQVGFENETGNTRVTDLSKLQHSAFAPARYSVAPSTIHVMPRPVTDG